MNSVVLALVAVVLAAAAYAELVLDVRTPRSTLVDGHHVQAVMDWQTENLDKAMKAKKYADARTAFENALKLFPDDANAKAALQRAKMSR